MTAVADVEVPFRRAADGVYEVTAADLFCGAGGTSTGLVEAVEAIQAQHGITVRLNIVAVNHWPVAIETHSANHKFAQHHCNSLTGVKPKKVIPGPLDLLVASPECTHHSNARGGKPRSDQSRSSGDDVVRWIRELKPRMVIIENVREYRSWGPLTKEGYPDKRRKGELFQKFLSDIRALGYSTEDRLLCCADYGDPTTRTRLFIYCKRGGGPIRWPTATHAKDSTKLLVEGLSPWRTARQDVIDWDDLGLSIFGRKKPLSVNTLRRIEAGLHKFSGIDLRGYLVKLYGTSDVSSVDEPLPTVTGGGGHIALAVPFLLGQQSPAAPRSVDSPVPTVAGAGAIAHVEPFMVAHFGEREGQDPRVHSVDAPAPAVTSRGAAELAQPFVTEYHGDDAGRERVRPVTDPMPTLDCANRFGLAQPFMMSAGGPEVGPRSTEEPAHTVLTRDHIGLAAPFITAAGGPEGMGRQPHSVDEPLGTVVGENHRAVIVPVTHQDPAGKDRGARSVDAPLPTVTTAHRGELGVATACLVRYNGSSDVESVDKPMGTLTTKPKFALLVTYTDGRQVVLDILFRMLRPRELARAQSFPDGYKFTGSTADIVKQIGNAVPVKMAKALCMTGLMQMRGPDFPPLTERSPGLIPGPTEPSGRPSGLERAPAGKTMRGPADGKTS